MYQADKKPPQHPFFSIVIPVHNKAPYIQRCLKSALDQTCQNYEILLIDDASTDSSMEEVGKFSDARLRIFRRETPGAGGYAARNLGIEKARGEWIAFLDADDQWHKEHLEQMHALSRLYPHVSFMACGWEKKKGKEKSPNPFFTQFHAEGKFSITLREYLKSGIKNMLPVCTLVACIKKNSPLASQLFPSETQAKRGGDIHAWLKIMCYHKQMAWSNHLGAIYHTDSMNMVTKTAETGTDLLQPHIYKDLAEHLNAEEKLLLKKYLNIRLKKSLVTSIKINQRKYQYRNSIYWKGDFFTALKLYILSLLPVSLLHRGRKRRLKHLKMVL
ncbi:MAG: glycosyltransferase family A protein [Bacteroidales bacterium]